MGKYISGSISSIENTVNSSSRKKPYNLQMPFKSYRIYYIQFKSSTEYLLNFLAYSLETKM